MVGFGHLVTLVVELLAERGLSSISEAMKPVGGSGAGHLNAPLGATTASAAELSPHSGQAAWPRVGALMAAQEHRIWLIVIPCFCAGRVRL